MDTIAILGIIVAALIYLVLRPHSGQGGESRGCAVAGLTALFFVLAFLGLLAFIFVPPLRDWMDGLIGPGQSGDAFGFGRLVAFLMVAGGISSLASLAVVLAVSYALRERWTHSPPGSRKPRG